MLILFKWKTGIISVHVLLILFPRFFHVGRCGSWERVGRKGRGGGEKAQDACSGSVAHNTEITNQQRGEGTGEKITHVDTNVRTEMAEKKTDREAQRPRPLPKRDRRGYGQGQTPKENHVGVVVLAGCTAAPSLSVALSLFLPPPHILLIHIYIYISLHLRGVDHRFCWGLMNCSCVIMLVIIT